MAARTVHLSTCLHPFHALQSMYQVRFEREARSSEKKTTRKRFLGAPTKILSFEDPPIDTAGSTKAMITGRRTFAKYEK